MKISITIAAILISLVLVFNLHDRYTAHQAHQTKVEDTILFCHSKFNTKSLLSCLLDYRFISMERRDEEILKYPQK